MACKMPPISQTQCFGTHRTLSLFPLLKKPGVGVLLVWRSWENTALGAGRTRRMSSVKAMKMPRNIGVSEKEEEAKGFVDEMRAVAIKLHHKEGKPVERWEPTVEGYLRFFVDSKVVYDTMESIVAEAAHPWYAEFKNTGLERSEKLTKDLEWFKEQGHAIPEPSTLGLNYSECLKELSKKDPQAFICHFYNIYFAHCAGGRIIGKKVAEKILDGKELEFYKWQGDLRQLLQNVREKLKVANDWSREEKNHCLEETEKSFKYSGDILRLILS